ncbi:MAG: transcription antitermination factor NusB [Oligoflexales bacterium]
MSRQKITEARRIAYDALVRVSSEKIAPSQVVEELAKNSKELRSLDRRFIKEMLWGALRWHSKLYWILQKTSEKRNLDDTTPEVRAALVMGTYQIYYMDRVPDRAAVSQSAEYVRSHGQHQAVGFVNGMLRSIARKSKYFQKPDKEKEPIAYLSLQYAAPRWVVERWFDRFGYDKTKALLQGINTPALGCLRVNQLKVSGDDAFQQLSHSLLKEEHVRTKSRPLSGCLQADYLPLPSGPSFANGLVTIQGESSQVMASLVDPQESETIYDVCCGPGGKTTSIFEASGGRSNVIGMDAQPHAIHRAKEQAARLGHSKIQWKQQDFLEWKREGACDKILLDAPCSGLGVLQKHPEGKMHKTKAHLRQMVELQKKMITHALDQLSSGETLIYSVCSFEPEESSDHLSWIQKAYDGKIEVVTPVRFLPNYYKKFVTRDNLFMVLAGHKEGLDGFSAFIVQKK